MTSSDNPQHKMQEIADLVQRERLFHPSLGDVSNIAELRGLVLSDPKTASTSVAKSLQYSLNAEMELTNVIHMHTNASCLHRLFPILGEKQIGIEDLVAYRNSFRTDKLTLVTIFRDPIARAVSHFFESIETLTGFSAEELVDASFDDIRAHFGAGQLLARRIHWQYEEYFGIRIADIEFDRVSGVGYAETDLYRVFVGRMDKLDGLGQALTRIPEFSQLTLAEHNIGEQKWYSHLYAEMKEKLSIPRNLLDLAFWIDAPYLNNLYTEEEVGQMLGHWEKHAGPPNPRYRQIPTDFNWRRYLEKNPAMILGPKRPYWEGPKDEHAARWHYATFTPQRRVVELEKENEELRRLLRTDRG